MKELRFYNNHNHNNKQAKRAEQAEAPPSRFLYQQDTPGGGMIDARDVRRKRFWFGWVELGVRDAVERWRVRAEHYGWLSFDA